jgi:hypothetical protein
MNHFMDIGVQRHPIIAVQIGGINQDERVNDTSVRCLGYSLLGTNSGQQQSLSSPLLKCEQIRSEGNKFGSITMRCDCVPPQK